MISHKLQTEMHLAETLIFPIWQKANPKERERITKELGETHAKMIIAEINAEAEKLL